MEESRQPILSVIVDSVNTPKLASSQSSLAVLGTLLYPAGHSGSFDQQSGIEEKARMVSIPSLQLVHLHCGCLKTVSCPSRLNRAPIFRPSFSGSALDFRFELIASPNAAERSVS